MTGRIRWRATAAVLAAAAVVLAACGTGSDAVTHGGTFEFVSPGGQTEIHYDPPSDRGTIGTLTGESLMDESKKLSLSDYQGQVVVLNIWGYWCAPCRSEVPALEQVYDATRDEGVQFLGIDVRDHNRTNPQDFFRRNDVTYPSIYDPPMRTLAALGDFPTSVVPSTVVLDRQHRVAAVFLKALTAEELQPVVEKVAAEQPAGA